MGAECDVTCLLSKVVSSLLGVLVGHYVSECSLQDLQRMELLVMQKLNFNLTSLTALDFLKTVHNSLTPANTRCACT